MKMSRKWEMPNSKTFQIKAIQEIILRYAQNDYIVLDPFANEGSIREHLRCKQYINNDIDETYKTDYHLEAHEFLKQFENDSVDMVLCDPPYSPRQVSECYKQLGKTVTMMDTAFTWYTDVKKEISRVIKPGGICITCCWNTNGIGSKYDFELLEVLCVAHGGMHNDTLVTVERKRSKLF